MSGVVFDPTFSGVVNPRGSLANFATGAIGRSALVDLQGRPQPGGQVILHHNFPNARPVRNKDLVPRRLGQYDPAQVRGDFYWWHDHVDEFDKHLFDTETRYEDGSRWVTRGLDLDKTSWQNAGLKLTYRGTAYGSGPAMDGIPQYVHLRFGSGHADMTQPFVLGWHGMQGVLQLVDVLGDQQGARMINGALFVVLPELELKDRLGLLPSRNMADVARAVFVDVLTSDPQYSGAVSPDRVVVVHGDGANGERIQAFYKASGGRSVYGRLGLVRLPHYRLLHNDDPLVLVNLSNVRRNGEFFVRRQRGFGHGALGTIANYSAGTPGQDLLDGIQQGSLYGGFESADHLFESASAYVEEGLAL